MYGRENDYRTGSEIMGKLKDLTGQKFNHLKVKERAGTDHNGNSTWLCICDLWGTETIVASQSLQRGNTKSCGCLASGGREAYLNRSKNKLGTVGERIEKYRKEAGMSQQELAEKIKKSVRLVNQYEKDEVSPSLITAIDICIVLNKSVTDLVYRESSRWITKNSTKKK